MKKGRQRQRQKQRVTLSRNEAKKTVTGIGVVIKQLMEAMQKIRHAGCLHCNKHIGVRSILKSISKLDWEVYTCD
jgi:hypothetical protein